MIINHS